MFINEQMVSIELIIFDCDGVLIDSEILVCTFVSEELTRLGYPITTEEVILRYAGRPEREMVADIEQNWGQPVPASYFTEVKRRVADAFTSSLKITPGVLETVPEVRIPICVASSSAPEKLRMGLTYVQLHTHFAPNIVSASYVAHGKPAPDVFIYAAGWMKISVEKCLVIEDSLPGVRAAKSAGMRVFGYAGGSHCAPGHDRRLLEAGAELVLRDMRELRTALPAAFLRRDRQ